jgi:hypothetical protein
MEGFSTALPSPRDTLSEFFPREFCRRARQAVVAAPQEASVVCRCFIVADALTYPLRDCVPRCPRTAATLVETEPNVTLSAYSYEVFRKYHYQVEEGTLLTTHARHCPRQSFIHVSPKLYPISTCGVKVYLPILTSFFVLVRGLLGGLKACDEDFLLVNAAGMGLNSLYEGVPSRCTPHFEVAMHRKESRK